MATEKELSVVMIARLIGGQLENYAIEIANLHGHEDVRGLGGDPETYLEVHTMLSTISSQMFVASCDLRDLVIRIQTKKEYDNS